MGKLEDAKQILYEFGLPKGQQNDRSAYTLLALSGLTESDPWSAASNEMIGIHTMMRFIFEHYRVEYAENSRESFRRRTIHQFEQAGIVERNRDDLSRSTNSMKTVYSLTPEALKVIKSYGSDSWEMMKSEFLESSTTLSELYANKRVLYKVPIHIGEFVHELSAGDHNILQKEIIDEFAPRFAQGSALIYLGDTAKKHLYIRDDILSDIGIPITKHDKLPDVVLYDQEKNWLFLCEAVTSHGPMNPKRVIELQEMLKECDCYKIYISCFSTKQKFKEYWDDIAWETEVWISSEPDHMIHFNGDKFLRPAKHV